MLSGKKLIFELLVFYSVVENGTMSIAAKQLGVSVSTISKSLSKLELLLGATLLRRKPNGVQVTDVGRIVHDKAKIIVSTFHALVSEVKCKDGVVCGNIRLSAPSVICDNIANEWVYEFVKKHRDVKVQLFSLERNDLSVYSPEFDDLVLQSGVSSSPDLVHSKLIPIPLVICASPAYLDKNIGIVRPSDLINHNILKLNHPSLENLRLIKGDSVISVEIDDGITLTSNNVTSIVNLARKGEGICIAAPYWLVKKYLHNGELKGVLMDWCIPPLEMYLIWRYREYNSYLFKAFKGHIQGKWTEFVLDDTTEPI